MTGGLDHDAPLLVLAPHPDDETLGCGLLLADRWVQGLPTHVACLTDGAASHPGSLDWSGPRLAALRRNELKTAIRRLGGDPARDLTWMGLPDAGLHRLHGPGEDLVRRIAALVDRLGVRTLVAASPADPHCDHLAGGEAARRVLALRPGLALWFYPVWSRWHTWTSGTCLADAAAMVVRERAERRDRKAAALAAHRSQMGRVVRDDPMGFAMPAGFADRFVAEPELFLPVRA